MMCNAPQETNSKVIINTRRSLIRTFLDIELLALVLFFMNTANIQHSRTSSRKVHAV